MRYAQIRKFDISNGEGIACSLFVQGCTHRCEGCFNKETWNFDGGKEFTQEVLDKFISLCNKEHVKCVSILGGEPLDQPEILEVLKEIKSKVNKPLYLWTGYLIENIDKELLKYIDVLIDGKFELDKRDLSLKLRGSSNQRVLRKGRDYA